MDILHVFGPDSPHSTVHIVGSLECLNQLIGQLQQVVETGDKATREFYVNDGEGYDLVVNVIPKGYENELLPPYTDHDYYGDDCSKSNFIAPWKL